MLPCHCPANCRRSSHPAPRTIASKPMPASRAKRAEGKSLEADVRGARIAMPSRLEKLAAVRGRFQRLDVEAALGRHLEGGPRRIAPPFRARPDVGPAGQAGQ